MRRSHQSNNSRPTSFSLDGLEFNLKLREVTLESQSPKSLTQLESRLLESLMLNAGQALTFDDLISDVWGPGGGTAEMLRQLVRRLRSKVEKDPTHPHYIQNLPGLGYAFLLKR
jgi:DNA-binding response OmpR family regulator